MEDPEEIQQVRELARQFAEAELRPHTEVWDREATLPPGLLAQLAELGFLGMLVPEAAGGMGFGPGAYAAAVEELAWGEASVAVALAQACQASELLLALGSDAQRERWLAPMAAGETLGCVARAEPEAGWDPSAPETTAEPDGGGWVLRGRKAWVVNGAAADVAIIFARVADGGPGLFLVPTDAEGYRPGAREKTMGLRPLEVVTVTLADVRLDADARLAGAAADAAPPARSAGLALLAVAAEARGIARAALEHAVRYAGEREQFETRLRDFEGIQAKLAGMASRVEAAGALLERACARPETSLPAMAKLFASEGAMWVTTEAVQIYGGYGYMRDYPVEKLMRDAKATELLEASSETLRRRIARSLYGA